MRDFVFHNPCRIIFGKDTAATVGAETAQYGRKILLVTGGGSIRKSGLYDRVVAGLQEQGITYFEVGGVQPNPRLTSVYEGIRLCKQEGLEFILAVGGGSVVDAAKAMAAGAKYEGDVWDFFEQRAVIQDALPLGDIITLAATGTEMNGNAVVTKWETNQKLPIGSPLLIPRFSILDPALTATVPRDQTVNGIVDIMAHVFEQYFSPTPATILVDRMAESVLKTMIEIAPAVLQNPADYDARAEMLWSGTIALNSLLSCGKITDWATHMIEHEISAIYDIPHGAGLAIVFPNWMSQVMDNGLPKFKQYAERVWDVAAAGRSDREIALDGIERTRQFFNRIGAPATLGHYEIGPERIPEMAEKAVRFGPLGNFQELGKGDVEAILRRCL